MQKTFYCSRPGIVGQLSMRGFESTTIPNPYDSAKNWWIYELTPELAKAVSDLYADNGIELPSIIRNALKNGGVQ